MIVYFLQLPTLIMIEIFRILIFVSGIEKCWKWIYCLSEISNKKETFVGNYEKEIGVHVN